MNAESLDLMLQRELPAAADGCEYAYGRVVGACQNTVTSIALAITRDVQASEDIAQEAFLKAWQHLSRLNNHASFLPWLRQITRNLARDWLRANRNRAMTGQAADIAIGMAADPAPSPAERMLQLEEEQAATDIISALPEDSRETLLLYYREGQRSQQVAELLGISDAAVRKRLSRARATVREEMLKRFGEFARSSAPGATFATLVVSVGMVAAPASASAAIIIGSGLGGAGTGAGKLASGLGLGLSTLSGATAAASLGALSSRLQMIPGTAWASILIGLIGGSLGSYLGGFYLLRYAETADERRAIRSFMRISTLTAAAICFGVLLLSLAGIDKAWSIAVLAAGIALVNYQCLGPLRRVMAPMLARDAARRGRDRPSWVYQSLYGRPAILVMNLVALCAVLHVLHRNGVF